MWQLSLLTMVAVVYGIANLLADDTPESHSWTPFASIIYNCFSKTGWSLALAWIVFSCHKGYGGVVNSFLSWRAWIPLSKLTYGAYLIHITCQMIVLFGTTVTLHFTDFMMVSFILKRAHKSSKKYISVCLLYWHCMHGIWSLFCTFLEC